MLEAASLHLLPDEGTMKKRPPTKKPKRRTHKKPKPRQMKKRAVGRPRLNLAAAARARGKKGELDARNLWREHGYTNAERGIQIVGGRNAPDIVVPGVTGTFHIEVKNVEQFSLYTSLAQAIQDAGPFQTPIVMHKRNEQEFVVVLKAEDFISLVKKAGYVPVVESG